MLSELLIPGFVCLLAAVLTWRLAQLDAPIRILDHPNERSLHSRPIPRTGGIAICAAMLSGWLIFAITHHWHAFPLPMLLGAAIIMSVSIADDRFGLSPLVRITVQSMAALVLVSGDLAAQGELLPGIPAADSDTIMKTLVVLLTLWLTNLYNFMDGMDGFAGGMAVIGFGAMAALGYGQNDILFAGAALAVSAAAAGFLWFNFPPARIFMGDSGSTTLGFLVAAFAVWGSRRGVAPVWVTLVVFSPFVVDATVTLIRRALHGEPIWRAHRSHYYQRLVQLGWSHRRTVLVEYFVMLICAATALSLVGSDVITQWTVLAVLAFGYFCAALVVHRMERSR